MRIRESCELITPASAEAWAAYHDIRRKVLFENRGQFGVYDPEHPDDRSPHNFPKVLVESSRYIGVVRIDFAIDTAYLRTVAIAEPHQRRGFGRVLIGLAEKFACERGVKRIEAIVAADAVGFYRKCGYGLLGAAGDATVPMYKEMI